MSVPIPPPDPYNQAPSLWRRLTVILLLAIWPAGALILLLGSAAGEENPLGRGFTTLAEAPWWALTSAAMALVTVTLFAIPASLRLAADITIRASSLALVMTWGLDPAIADTTGTPRRNGGRAAHRRAETGHRAPPRRLTVSPGAGLLVFFGSILYHVQNTSLTLARYFLAGYLLFACRF